MSLPVSNGDNGLPPNVSLGIDTSMLHVSWLVRRLASVGVLREFINVSKILDLRLGDLGW
jgi:hypothetical protein